MEGYSDAIMLIGLTFSVINIIFIILSSLLIYSLLMITVETKDFENGILRLVGLSKLAYSCMILLQAVSFVLPSIILGFAVSPLCLWALNSFLFSADMGIKHSYFPSGMASLQALGTALVIPLLSSIIPIKRAITRTLAESLNYQRAKTSGVQIDIKDTQYQDVTPMVLGGLLVTIYGITIYYCFPLAFLSGNYNLLLSMLFIILLGMVVGLSLLAFNLQGLL